MTQPGKYILFFSKQCRYSQEFITQLYKYPELYRKFTIVDVKNKKIKIPPEIREVPTIIVPGPYQNDVHVGPNALNWLSMASNLVQAGEEKQEQQQKPIEGQIQQTPGGIADYDPSAMSGFSDSFTLIDDGGNALLENDGGSLLGKNFQSLATLGDTMSAPPPPEENLGDGSMKKDAAARRLEELQAQRDRDVPQPINRM